jgi:hypothetical protein
MADGRLDADDMRVARRAMGLGGKREEVKEHVDIPGRASLPGSVCAG